MTEPTTNGVVPAVKATQVHKAFGSLHVLKGVDMTVMPGSVTVILGPSGSGKSTFLRLINQLETLTGGEIDVDGEMIGYKYVDKDGKQVETPDYWLANEEPWGHIDYNRDQKVSFGGKVVENADGTKTWQPAWSVRAVPVDYLVPGYKSGRVNTLRLWSAKSYDEFDLLAFNRSEYMEAVTPQVKAENISKILYPEDSTKVGKELRGMMSWMKK